MPAVGLAWRAWAQEQRAHDRNGVSSPTRLGPNDASRFIGPIDRHTPYWYVGRVSHSSTIFPKSRASSSFCEIAASATLAQVVTDGVRLAAAIAVHRETARVNEM